MSWLGAVQAQDYTGAAWGVALRARDLTAVAFEREFAAGRILRTHVMRQTWHFVAQADIRWLQALTGPRVRAASAYYAARLAIDARLMTRARTIVERALEGGQYLTRDELAERLLQDGRIEAAGQRLAYIVMALELDAVICSGPRRGKQFTYALVEERAPQARVLPRDEALAELARRYFQSHGPATVHDFGWWSGLPVKDARAAAATVAADLVLREPPAPRTGGRRRLPAAQLRRVPDRLPRPRGGDRSGAGAQPRHLHQPSSTRTTSCSTAASPAAGGGPSARGRRAWR